MPLPENEAMFGYGEDFRVHHCVANRDEIDHASYDEHPRCHEQSVELEPIFNPTSNAKSALHS